MATQWITYDPDADALAIEFAAGRATWRTVEVVGGVRLDLDRQGRPITLEILDASRRVRRALLGGLPAPGRLLTLRAAARQVGVTPDTLRQQVRAGRLVGVKQGRDWFVSESALRDYRRHVARARRSGRRTQPTP